MELGLGKWQAQRLSNSYLEKLGLGKWQAQTAGNSYLEKLGLGKWQAQSQRLNNINLEKLGLGKWQAQRLSNSFLEKLGLGKWLLGAIFQAWSPICARGWRPNGSFALGIKTKGKDLHRCFSPFFLKFSVTVAQEIARGRAPEVARENRK